MTSVMPQLGFGRSRQQAKNFFFDRPGVMRMMDRRTRRFLMSAGGYVRTTAIRSIKPRRLALRDMTEEDRKAYKRRRAIARFYGRPDPRRPRDTNPSRPGQPPRSQTGLLRENIFFSFDPDRRSVVIGPARLANGSNAPAVLEHGGVVRIGRRSIRVAPRPYMGPALERSTTPSRIRSFWGTA